MKRVGLFNIVALLLVAAVAVAFAKYIVKDRNEFNQLLLAYSTDYATDAATAAVLETGELSMDYGESGKTNLNPNMALDAFVDVFLMNYDLLPSADNRAHVRNNFLPVFMVATFDGYYMAQPRLTHAAANYPENAPTDVDWTLLFGPKMPYKYASGANSWALNFGDYVLKISGNVLSKEYTYPPGLADKDAVVREINKVISTDISYGIDNFNKENYNWHNTFYIPTQLTSMTGVNRVNGPSVIVIVQNMDLNTITPISSFSIGGGKINAKRIVVGYNRNSINYYCYADKFESIVPQPAVLDMFPSMKDAARAGYAADLMYLQ